MRNRKWLGALAILALLAGACGGGTAGEATTTSSTSTSSTSTSSSSTSSTSTSSTSSSGDVTTTTGPTTTAPGGADAVAFQAALDRSAGVESGRMEGEIEIVGPEGTPAGTSISMTWSGAFDNATGAFGFTMDLGSILEQAAASGEDIPAEMAGMFDEIEMRTVGDTAYIRFPFFSAFLGVETEWLSMPADEAGGATDSFSFGANPANPADLLAAFEGADASIEEVGRESVRGVDTTHYRVQVDVASLTEQADPDQLAELEGLGPLPFDQLPLDVWIGDDGLVRRFAMSVDGSSVASPAGEGFESMVMTFELFDLGEPVAVQAPPASQVTDVSTLDFNPFADAT